MLAGVGHRAGPRKPVQLAFFKSRFSKSGLKPLVSFYFLLCKTQIDFQCIFHPEEGLVVRKKRKEVMNLKQWEIHTTKRWT